VECYTGYILAYFPQPRDQLEDRRSKDNKMFRRVWETVETKAREVRMAEIEKRRKK